MCFLGQLKVKLDKYMEHLNLLPHHRMLSGVMFAVICVTNVVLQMFVGGALPNMTLQGYLIALFASLTLLNIAMYITTEVNTIRVLRLIKTLNYWEMNVTAVMIAAHDGVESVASDEIRNQQ